MSLNCIALTSVLFLMAGHTGDVVKNSEQVKPKPPPGMVQQMLLRNSSKQTLLDKHGYLMNSASLIVYIARIFFVRCHLFFVVSGELVAGQSWIVPLRNQRKLMHWQSRFERNYVAAIVVLEDNQGYPVMKSLNLFDIDRIGARSVIHFILYCTLIAPLLCMQWLIQRNFISFLDIVLKMGSIETPCIFCFIAI